MLPRAISTVSLPCLPMYMPLMFIATSHAMKIFSKFSILFNQMSLQLVGRSVDYYLIAPAN